jgi:hypothetical protein
VAVERYLAMIDEKAQALYPDWEGLPNVDPLRTLAGFVAIVAADLKKDVDAIESAVTSKLPAIFGVRPQSATAASGFVRLIPSATHRSPALIPAGLKMTASKGQRRIGLHTVHDVCLFDFGEIDIEQDEDHVWIGLERVPFACPFSLYIDCSEDHSSVGVTWKIASSKGLDDLEVLDRTYHLCVAGLLSLSNFTSNAKPQSLFGKERYWIVAQFHNRVVAPIRRVVANVTAVSNVASFRNYVIGSGRGIAGQRLKMPEGQLLRCSELMIFNSEEGCEEQWTLQSSLLASIAGDRHFIYDHESNEIVFGDGRQGRIVPAGYDNVWATHLEMTQGASANIDKDASTNLAQPDWRISGAELLHPLKGGTNHSGSEDLLVKMHEVFHHKERAVSLRDFERLASMGSPKIGLAFSFNPSFGTVVVIPILRPEFSDDPESLDFRPDASDIDALQNFLEQRRALNIKLCVKSPRYRRLIVTGSIQIMGSIEVNLGQIRTMVTQYFSPYRSSELRLRPGSKIETRALANHVMSLDHVIHVADLKLIDEQSGVSVDFIQLAPDELPKVSVKLRFDEVGI